MLYYQNIHCVKSVCIRNFFWSVFSCIRTEYGEIRIYNFHAVIIARVQVMHRVRSSVFLLQIGLEFVKSTKETQKQPFAVVRQNKCSRKFRNIHRKTPVLRSFFKKVVFSKKGSNESVFLKFLRTPFFAEHLRRLLLESLNICRRRLDILLRWLLRAVFRTLSNICDEDILGK